VAAIVRAIDVGYKNTKWVLSAADPRIECRVFPSVAPTATGRDLSEALGRRRNTVIVEADGLKYEVGPDAPLAEKAAPAQSMDGTFCTSPEYLALVRGALHYMKVEHVDLLVVGLPVSAFELRKHELARRLRGSHPLSEGKAVAVREVKVLAQPHGALIHYALTENRLEAMESQRNLIIDSGGRTFDFLVTEGLKVVERRSDDAKRGMHDVTRELAAEIGRALQTEYTDYERLDAALRLGRAPLVFGKPYDLEPHLPAVRKIAEEAVMHMRRYVQDGSDLDNIILSGGSAFFFRDAVQAAFPRHKIQHLDGGLYANVRGYQLYGMAKMHQAERRGAKGEEGVADPAG
jgi:plasmid segregation protein ParM